MEESGQMGPEQNVKALSPMPRDFNIYPISYWELLKVFFFFLLWKRNVKMYIRKLTLIFG